MDCRGVLEETPLKVITYVGNNGVIGRVLEEPYRGLVVLFASQPDPGIHVLCYSYEIRTSPRTGKNYVKCFEWATPDNYEELKKECAVKALEENIERLVEPLPEEYRSVARRLLRGETVTVDELPEDIVAVAVGGTVSNYKDRAYVAVVDSNWVVYDNGEYCDGLHIVSRMPYMLGRVDLPDSHTVIICNTEYTFMPEKYKKLAEALGRLDELDIPDEIKEKVKEKLVRLAGGA